MHWLQSINLYFYALTEVLFFFPSHQLLTGYFLKALEKTKLMTRVIRETLFPLRANFLTQNRNNRIVTFEEIKRKENGDLEVIQARVILPPASIEYKWNYVEGVYIKDDFSSELSDTDEDEGDETPVTKVHKEDSYEIVNLTTVLSDCKGPFNDFYGSSLTPYMIDAGLHKLVFYKKDRKSGDILIREEFTTHQPINLIKFS